MPTPKIRLNFIGTVLREYRDKAGLSQEKLGLRLNVSHNYVGKLENGRIHPSIETLVKFAIALNIRPGELLDSIVEKELASKNGMLHQFLE